ncbi:MAG: MFS transporter [Alphaproteobacteria bacterium]|nr:MAG: MFS transporter [Alphaproteobacteria bacterium]
MTGLGGRRIGIVLLIFVTVVINYMDRANIAVAAPAMSKDLGMTPVQMGFVFSAFAWTYSGLQIPGGILADIVKPRVLYPFLLLGWSLATMLQGFANTIAALLGCRAAVGACEAPSYSVNNKIVTEWFPVEQRASAIGVYTSGQFIGLAFMTPILFAIQYSLGWRGLFLISGAIGIVWAGIWYLAYRDASTAAMHDREDDQVSLAHGGSRTKKATRFCLADQKVAFAHRKLWGIYLGQYCLGTVTIFFLTWFPTYLVEYRGISLATSGVLAAIPFLAAFAGVLLAGFVSDGLYRRGFSSSLARKAPVLLGMLLSASVIGANYTDDTAAIITFLSIGFFGNGFASIAWVFVSLIAPAGKVGLVGGVFNFAGGLSAVVTPIAIGYLVKDNHFASALYYMGFFAVAGTLSYLFLVGEVKRIDDGVALRTVPAVASKTSGINAPC